MLLSLTILCYYTIFIELSHALVFPPEVLSKNGKLSTRIEVRYTNLTSSANTVINARVFNGMHPGPTFVFNPGDELEIEFVNKLTFQPYATQYGKNIYMMPDVTNLHWHGLHVSGELPSSDIRLHVREGKKFDYYAVLPKNHMPGTHWMHAHVHGSVSLQLGNGASNAMIIKDPPGTLPSDIEAAEDILLFCHLWELNTLKNIADEVNDKFYGIGDPDGEKSYVTVNGEYIPDHSMKVNEWQRWRIVWSSWQGAPLRFTPFGASLGCKMYLLAKDGIYVKDYPRGPLFQAPIPTAGRADVMMRCTQEGTFRVDWSPGRPPLMNVNVLPSDSVTLELIPWTPTYPDYIKDVRGIPADPGCSCSTKLADNSVNNFKWSPWVYLHTTRFGSIVERDLIGVNTHPYHQHIYPFQLIYIDQTGLNKVNRDYFKEGDFHDVLMVGGVKSPIKMRYQVATDLVGGTRMFVHCHRLNHGDRGMMTQELIVIGGECVCDALLNRTGTLQKVTAAEMKKMDEHNIFD